MDSIFRHLIQNMSNGYSYNKLILDENDVPVDYLMLDVNPAFEKLTGLSKSKLVGKKIKEALPFLLTDIDDWIQAYVEVCKTGKSICFESFSDTLNKWFRITAYSPEPSCFASILEDITYRRICESETKYLKEFYETVLDGIINGVWVADKNDYIYYVNRGMAKISGVDASQINGKNVLTDFKNDKVKEFNEKFVQAKKQMKPVFYDGLDVTTLSGRLSYQSGWFIPLIQDSDYKGMICTVDDITEKKIAQDTKEKLSKENENKNKELESILYVTSHDLRTPLLNIQGYSDEVKKSVEEIKSIFENCPEISDNDKKMVQSIYNDDLSLFLKYIHVSVLKMDLLLESLRKVSRAGREILIVSEINMDDLTDEVFNTIKYLAEEKNIKLTRDPLLNLKGDRKQISQVMTNLIGNAIKYMEKNDDPKIHVSCEMRENNPVYCIEDNGPGISEKDHQKIFQIFFRVNPKSEEAGEGIGLTVVKRFVGKHRGNIWVESKEGEGSKFFFSIPKDFDKNGLDV